MFKKTLVAAGLAAALTATSAQAFVIQFGAYKMTVDGYSNGTIYDPNAAGVVCNSASSCDTAAMTGSKGSTPPEDSWGILSIASITNTTTNTIFFTRGVDGYLTGSFTGITDNYVTADGFGLQKEYATGGVINLYATAANYDPAISSANQANVLNQFTGSPLWLSLAFVLGAGSNAQGILNSYIGTFDSTTGHAGGSGFLSVTGGSAQAEFDTNIFVTTAGNIADAFFTVTGKSPLSNDKGYNNWLLNDTIDVQGETKSVPEPGSIALAGLGLFALGASRRRKQQA